jgi:hypothetical protein
MKNARSRTRQKGNTLRPLPCRWILGCWRSHPETGLPSPRFPLSLGSLVLSVVYDRGAVRIWLAPTNTVESRYAARRRK